MKQVRKNKKQLIKNSEGRVGNTVLADPTIRMLWPSGATSAHYYFPSGPLYGTRTASIVSGVIIDPETVDTDWCWAQEFVAGSRAVLVHGLVTCGENQQLATVQVCQGDIVCEYRHSTRRNPVLADPILIWERS